MSEQQHNNGGKQNYPRKVAPSFNNKPKQNNNKLNYVQQQVQKMGEDFAFKKTTEYNWQRNFPREAKRLFADMRNGFFNPYNDSYYIIKCPLFVDMLIKVAHDKKFYYEINHLAMDMLKNNISALGPIDPNILSVDQYNVIELKIWEIIENSLMRAKGSPFYVQEFEVMMNQIRSYKQPINI